MAGFRLPGVLGMMSGATPIDDGTLARAASPSPGPVGIPKEPTLSEYDLSLIQTSWLHLSVDQLRSVREDHIRRKAEAARGAHGWGVLFEQAAIDRLTELIETAASPLGKFLEQLRAQLDEAKKSGSKINDDQLLEIIRTARKVERQQQLLGIHPDVPTPELNDAIIEAVNLLADRKTATLEKLLEQAKRRGSTVTEQQVKKALEGLLTIERERQLLGLTDADAGGSKTMPLLMLTLDIFAERSQTALHDLIDKARGNINSVTDEQLTDAVAKVLGVEQQRQVLGISDNSSTQLLVEASDLFADRSKAALKDLIEKSKRDANSVTNEQVTKAVQKIVGVERQRQLMGVENTSSTDLKELSIATATILVNRKRAALAKLYDSGAAEKEINKATEEYEEAKDRLRELGGTVAEPDIKAGPMQVKSGPAKN